MVYRGQSWDRFYKINGIWKIQMKNQRLRIRSPRKNFKGVVKSLYVKQYRGNVWGNVRFKENYIRKLGRYGNHISEIQRSFGQSSLSQDSHFDFHQIMSSFPYTNNLKKKYSRWKRNEYPKDLTWYKQFYRTFNKENRDRHIRNLMYHRLNSFEGNLRRHVLRRRFREGSIKGNTFSGNLFIYRFVSRLSHFLYFVGFANTLSLSTRLIKGGFVSVNNQVIIDPAFKIPLYSRIHLNLSKFCNNLIYLSIISYQNISAIPSLEINYKLLSARFFRLCNTREIIFQGSLLEHMFLYEIFSPMIK